MIKAVLFDWGGVVAPNANGGWLNVLSGMLGISIEELLSHWRAAGYEELSKGLIEETVFWQRFQESLNSSLPSDISKIWLEGGALLPWPELRSFIHTLKKRHILTCVLSNTVKPLSTALRKAGVYENFDLVVLSDEVGLTKPDPKIYQLALDKLQITAEECIYVDDLSRNLTPATELGMKTVLASHDPHETIADIEAAMN